MGFSSAVDPNQQMDHGIFQESYCMTDPFH